MSENNRLSIAYHGGIAEHGQLHFYEQSRASYGFARMLITAEHFRKTGKVAQKIGNKNYVELLVTAPQKGSFITEVVIPTAKAVIPDLATVPLKAIMSYIFQLVATRSATTDENAIELAKIRLAEEKERTAQGQQITRQFETLADIVKTQSATTQQSLDLARYAVKTQNRAVARLNDDKAVYIDMARELEAELQRQKEISKVEDQIRKASPAAIAKLTSRVRPMIGEMGLPLRRSSDYFTVAAAANDNAFAYFRFEENCSARKPKDP